MEESFKDEEDVVFLHLQTVFEGAQSNTPERGAREAERQRVHVPVGHDARVDGSRLSLFMQRFGTGGTPWTTIIDRRGVVRMNRFTPQRAEMKRMIEGLLAEPAPEPASDRKEDQKQKQKERDD